MNSQQFYNWVCRPDFASQFPQPLIMGVLNVTPNSFSDAAQYLDLEKAKSRALEMVQQGADLIDVGGEASNPYGVYTRISVDEELSRVLPVIRGIREVCDVAISIDSCKAKVMMEAVHAGAILINDIMALGGDGALEVAQSLKVPVCLMHMQGQPETMQKKPEYPQGVVCEIQQFFSQRIAACIQAGIPQAHLLIDPGIGFGKTTTHNLTILKHLSALNQFERPILLGVSRKSMIGEVLDKPISERMIGGLAIAVDAMLKGVNIIRTHDVLETKQALCMVEAIRCPLEEK